MKANRKGSVELQFFATHCCCSTINSKFPPGKFLQSKHGNEASNDFETFVQNTQQIIWKYLAKFDDTADPSLVLVLQSCGCGTVLQLGAWSGHG